MKQKLKKLFIVDGYAILYRAHYALIRNPLITSYGFHTSALFGFTNQLIKIIKDENPDYLVCAFDSKEKTFRHKIYSDYKANRPEMPEELQKQIPHLWELLDGMNIPVLRKPGYEADDIIGTVTESVLDKKIESFIVSGDKDFMQLINDKIFLYTPGKRNSAPDIYDKDGAYGFSLGVSGAPETYLLKEDKILQKHIGIMSEKVWKDKFIPLINN